MKNNKRAFTLVELLIVIAIIAILFIIIIFSANVAIDKAMVAGVQTDFRSFQMALEQVSRENSGFNTFGWDTGDTNGNRIRDSFDVGDINTNGIHESDETWIGRKVYTETWTGIYSLTNPVDENDKSGILALENAINSNLNPQLHIQIHDDYTISMVSNCSDPWKTEYHGIYVSNALIDGCDRGGIVIYSNGKDQKFGSEHKLENGELTIISSSIYGNDDHALKVFCPYDPQGIVPTIIEITLNENINDDVTITEKENVNMELNDFIVNGTIKNDGTINVTNGTINKDGNGIANNGLATFENITINAGNTSKYAIDSREESHTVCNNVNIVSAGGGIAASTNSTLVFNSGTLAVNSKSTSGRYLFYAQGQGSVIMINGGTFSFDSKLNQKRAYVYANPGTTVYITGGTFGKASTRANYNKGIMGDGTVIITGGTFGFDPSQWVAEGYKAVKENNVWIVVPI